MRSSAHAIGRNRGSAFMHRLEQHSTERMTVLTQALKGVEFDAAAIPNYADRCRRGEPIATGFTSLAARLFLFIEELLFLSRAEARDIDLHLTKQDPEALLGVFGQDARVLSEHRFAPWLTDLGGRRTGFDGTAGCVHDTGGGVSGRPAHAFIYKSVQIEFVTSC